MDAEIMKDCIINLIEVKPSVQTGPTNFVFNNLKGTT